MRQCQASHLLLAQNCRSSATQSELLLASVLPADEDTGCYHHSANVDLEQCDLQVTLCHAALSDVTKGAGTSHGS